MTQPPRLQTLAEQLRPCPDAVDLDEQIEVAGETYYVKEIKKLFRSRKALITERGTTIEQVATILLPTPWNEHDPNAVAVLCEGFQVGHVPAELARNYHRPLADLACHGLTPVCWSRIWAKSDSGVVRARATVLAAECEVVAQLALAANQQAKLGRAAPAVIESPTAAKAAGPEAGWYPDPSEIAPFRWWDGATWTGRIRMRAD